MPRQYVTFALSDFSSLGRIDFQTGEDLSGSGIAAGDTITQSSSSASGLVLRVVLSNGSWAGGDAEGYLIYLPTSTAAFNAAGTDLDNGDSATADPTLVDGSGLYDGRFNTARYFVAFEHTPDMLPTDVPAYLTGFQLSLLRTSVTSDDSFLGFALEPDDVLQIPILSHNGRRVEMREGTFAVYARWIADTSKLLIFVCFQGIEGVGEGGSTTIKEAAMSLGGGECGDWVDIDLEDVTFLLAYETNDEGSPGDPTQPGPFSLAGDYFNNNQS